VHLPEFIAPTQRRFPTPCVRASWAVALLIGFLGSSAGAQATCRTGLNEGTLSSQIAASGMATALEYEGMRSRPSWAVAREANRTRILLDPSSHLHALGSYHIARSAYTTTCAGRAERVGAAWKSAAISFSVGLSKEVADGYYNGFSPTDLAVNVLGAGYAVVQAYVPALEHVSPTFSSSPGGVLQSRGARAAILNYAQQTTWLSASVHDLLPSQAARFWPAPVRFSAGRRANGDGSPSEYVLGLDLDAARLPGTHPVWLRAKRVLHHLRLPGPALVMTPRKTKSVGLYW
jgi:hypothetical protein